MGRILNIHGVDDVRLDPIESPRPGNADVVIRVKACGICGSDLSTSRSAASTGGPAASHP